MAGTKLDLNKVKEELQILKREKGVITDVNGRQGNPKDSFLHELRVSLHTGQATRSTQIIKEVANKASAKKGGALITDSPINSMPQQNYRQPQFDNSSTERDELMFQQFEQNNKKTLAESISEYTNPGQNKQNQPQVIGGAIQQATLSEHVDNFLNENVMRLMEGAIKNAILEIYAGEKSERRFN